MKFKLEIPIILERVKIEGPIAIREVNLILDTGARFTTLNWDLLKDIGYDPATLSGRVNMVTANGIIEAPLLRVESISIGELSCKNVEVVCHTIPELVEVDGLLGLSFLSHFKTIIDYREKVLEIL
jgi:aspartyl protease family protein